MLTSSQTWPASFLNERSLVQHDLFSLRCFMDKANVRNFKRVFIKTAILATLAMLPVYGLVFTAYASLTDGFPGVDSLTLRVGGVWMGILLLFIYFGPYRSGKLMKRLAIDGSRIKGALAALFGLIATSFVLGMLSAVLYYWVASHTPYTAEHSGIYDVVGKPTGRRGRTVRLVDESGDPATVRFGPWPWAGDTPREGDRIHLHCKGFDEYCRVIEWSRL